jgi:hypothetical protein
MGLPPVSAFYFDNIGWEGVYRVIVSSLNKPLGAQVWDLLKGEKLYSLGEEVSLSFSAWCVHCSDFCCLLFTHSLSFLAASATSSSAPVEAALLESTACGISPRSSPRTASSRRSPPARYAKRENTTNKLIQSFLPQISSGGAHFIFRGTFAFDEKRAFVSTTIIQWTAA